jgi:hypothetical protein
MGVDYFMVEIQHEEMGIEDLFIQDKDEKIKIRITLDQGDFRAYVTVITYGQAKQLDRMNEDQVADYILTNHFFKGNEQPFSAKELELLPAGVLKGVVETIMKLSGLDITEEDIQVF